VDERQGRRKRIIRHASLRNIEKEKVECGGKKKTQRGRSLCAALGKKRPVKPKNKKKKTSKKQKKRMEIKDPIKWKEGRCQLSDRGGLAAGRY